MILPVWRRWLPSLVLAAAFAGGLVTPPAARADAAEEKTAQAKALWQEANSHYAVGEFGPAADKYQAAYKLRPDAALLYNAAQSYRLAGNNEKALLLYKNYVMFYPNAKNVPNVQQQIQKLQEAIAAQEKAKTQPPTSTLPTAGIASGIPAGGTAVTPPPAPAPPAEVPVSRAAPVPTAPPPPSGDGLAATTLSPAASTTSNGAATDTGDQPIYKKWWLWTIVGVVVAGAAVGTVVALSGSKATTPWTTGSDIGPGAKAFTP